MTGAASEGMMQGALRTRVRTRVVRRGNDIRVTTHPLRHALEEVERQFLTWQSNSAAKDTPEVLSEYMSLIGALAGIDERLEDVSARTDIPYVTDRRLAVLKDYCRWLTRRVSTEFLLLLQVHFEQELKRVIGLEAYQVFLRFEDVEDSAREIERLSDHDLMARLRDGTLFRDVLEQARLGDVMNARLHLTLGPVEPLAGGVLS